LQGAQVQVFEEKFSEEPGQVTQWQVCSQVQAEPADEIGNTSEY